MIETPSTRPYLSAARCGALARRFGRAVIICVLLAPGASLASDGVSGETALAWQFELEPTASRIEFTFGATLHTVEGTFPLREGELYFDPETGDVTGHLVIDATGGDTGSARRDEVMHEQILESAEHPEFVLTPQAITGIERDADGFRGTLQASFRIHGETHPLAIPIDARRVEPGRGEVTGELEIPWVAWGLHDPSNFVLRVDKVMTLRFRVAGALQEP